MNNFRSQLWGRKWVGVASLEIFKVTTASGREENCVTHKGVWHRPKVC